MEDENKSLFKQDVDLKKIHEDMYYVNHAVQSFEPKDMPYDMDIYLLLSLGSYLHIKNPILTESEIVLQEDDIENSKDGINNIFDSLLLRSTRRMLVHEFRNKDSNMKTMMDYSAYGLNSDFSSSDYLSLLRYSAFPYAVQEGGMFISAKNTLLYAFLVMFKNLGKDSSKTFLNSIEETLLTLNEDLYGRESIVRNFYIEKLQKKCIRDGINERDVISEMVGKNIGYEKIFPQEYKNRVDFWREYVNSGYDETILYTELHRRGRLRL